MAFIDLVVKYGWDSVTILYENNDSMMRLKEIFTRTTKVRMIFDTKLSFLLQIQAKSQFLFRLYIQIHLELW